MIRKFKALGFILLVVAALMVFILPALAQDGRININDNLGGYAIYCVDGSNNPAIHYNEGGIRVLDSKGAEMLFVANARILEVGEPAENTLLGSAGSLSLYRLGGFPFYFQLNGVDLDGKEFAFQWLECDQSAPPPAEPECIPLSKLADKSDVAAPYDPCCPVYFPFSGPITVYAAPYCCYAKPAPFGKDASFRAC